MEQPAQGTATRKSLEIRRERASDNLSKLQKAINGEGEYGGVPAECASESQIDGWRAMSNTAMEAKKEIDHQLQLQQQQEKKQQQHASGEALVGCVLLIKILKSRVVFL